MDKEQQPVEAYRAIIDDLNQKVLGRGSAKLVKEKAIYSNAPEHRAFNDFIQSLDEDQKELLSQMMREERHGAIHDVLAELTWWIRCRGLGFTLRGEPMPVDLSGTGLHGDYVGRHQGWEWPEDDTDA